MPLCFTFVKNGEPVNSVDVDRAICEEFGVHYSATDYCIEYQVITMMGLAILTRFKVDPVTPEAFDSYIALNAEIHNDPEQNAKFKKFLCGDYSFHGWYQRHK